jgi:hypothetical protein
VIVWTQDDAGNYTVYRKPFTPHAGTDAP